MDITIIGSVPSAATTSAHMIRAGHDITLCDADEAHIAAIREHGLIIEEPGQREFYGGCKSDHSRRPPRPRLCAIVAVKSLRRSAAAGLLPRPARARRLRAHRARSRSTAHTLVEAVG